MTIFNMLSVALAMTAVALLWFGLHFYLNSLMKNPDGIAKVTGSCGDTMEIALKFNGPRVEDVHCWTDGCAISKMCVETVGMLARGKTVPELKKIDTSAILERVGNLPDTHMHCAVLAETTLIKAVSDCTLKNPSLGAWREECPEEAPPDKGRDFRADVTTAGKSKHAVYLFPSANYVMKAERILKELGIAHKIIPVPRHLSSDCGVCLRISQDQQEMVSEALREKVPWEHLAAL
ncbi:MAG: NifU-like protein [Syntrophus sp. PtaU1.Bin208]|nr:MAG: NifU-like protein [Syntrophus sp. PtaU1.Bin208]